MRPAYLDYGATTPLDPAVADAMAPYLTGRFGNPHSTHRWGYEAAAGVEAARTQVAALIGAPEEAIQFTGGATESVNWALKGVLTAPGQTRRGIVTVATEHSCVLESARYLEGLGAALTVLPVERDGRLDIERLRAVLNEDTALVSVMLVNNEIGVIQNVGEIAVWAHEWGALFHCDAAQGFGKLPIDVAALEVDLLSATAHKVYGPKGVGLLYRADGLELTPLLHGGGQEAGRSGTLAPMLCAGLGAAAAIAGDRMAADAAHAEALWERLVAGLDVEHWINGSTGHRWRGNISLTFPGLSGARLLRELSDIAVSAGSACAAASGRPSHVLLALGLSEEEARASLRLGWGRFTTVEEIDLAAAAINTAVRRLHRAGRRTA